MFLSILIFAGIYYLIGIGHLSGVHTGSIWKNFSEVFFFSAQTFTTVGYGRISPTGLITSTVATFEAFHRVTKFCNRLPVCFTDVFQGHGLF